MTDVPPWDGDKNATCPECGARMHMDDDQLAAFVKEQARVMALLRAHAEKVEGNTAPPQPAISRWCRWFPRRHVAP